MRSRGTDANIEVTLPITPMLDMAFQLLFFFVMNFNPSDLIEGQLDLSLPSDAPKQAIDKPKTNLADTTEDFPSDVTVKVRTRHGEGAAAGEISDLTVINSSTPDGSNNFRDDLDKLRAHLAERRKNTEGKGKDNIKVQGDGKLKWRSIMKVMDACRKAGYKNVSFVPPEDLGR
jgi:biopolymer transport protein ExbD